VVVSRVVPYRKSGDETLVRIINTLPEESFARLKGILETSATH
jgi:hypothetical protein